MTTSQLGAAIPVLFVRDVALTAAWFERLGFGADWLHGEPVFYGSVSRGGATVHLRQVDQPNFAELAAREESLIAVMIQVSDVAGLFAEFSQQPGLDFAQDLQTHPWGGPDFQVRGPDGIVVCFAQA